MRFVLLICLSLLTFDLAGAQWLDGSGQGFVNEMNVSGNNRQVLFGTLTDKLEIN
jgi:hypothetical protein